MPYVHGHKHKQLICKTSSCILQIESTTRVGRPLRPNKTQGMKVLFLVVAVTAAAHRVSSLIPPIPVSLGGVGSGAYCDMHQRHRRAFLPLQQLGNKQKPPPSKMALKAGTCDGDHDGESQKGAKGPGQSVLCVSESVYREAITRGQLYELLDRDDEKGQIRIVGDDGRTRWFPSYCFNFEEDSVPVLKDFTIDDTISNPLNDNIEVSMELSDGTWRWCCFVTPSLLATNGAWVEGTHIRFHYGLHHFIIVNELSIPTITKILREIDGQGELIECSLPLDVDDD